MPLIEGNIAAGRLVRPIAALEWNAGHSELVMNEERAENPAVRSFGDWIVARLRPPRQMEAASDVDGSVFGRKFTGASRA
jgi:hypothetical protein